MNTEEVIAVLQSKKLAYQTAGAICAGCVVVYAYDIARAKLSYRKYKKIRSRMA